ncbi:hypothetical protein GCM10018965_081630 [Nonomuraea roseola]
MARARHQNVCRLPLTLAPVMTSWKSKWLWFSVTIVDSGPSSSREISLVVATPPRVHSRLRVWSPTLRTRWRGASPSGVKRPQNSKRPGRSASACSASQVRSAAGSVRACQTSLTGAATRARRIIGSDMGLSLGVAGDGQLEGIALGSAVAGEQVLQNLT